VYSRTLSINSSSSRLLGFHSYNSKKQRLQKKQPYNSRKTTPTPKIVGLSLIHATAYTVHITMPPQQGKHLGT